ncbi:hypothetical protein [Alicyclobacillus mengziensis]|uniref:Uncharacterized protein n=1 Tax=Alicyclobacillus mengziensis TaxID=2931921 RepID=A0A9X7W175_9BACL|nr:hypothetical protein [Alicyclobacillus mengziensis]QSO48434.1 hypothetical protein JZ786_05450 [Alicyclobacillus mengziensis]
MKSYCKWAVASIALTMMGVLVGCGTTGSTSAPTKNATNTVAVNSTNTPTNASGTSTTNQTTNNTLGSVGENNSTTNNASVEQKPIAPSSANFVVTGIQAPKTVTVDGNVFTPPKLVHGVLEPIVMTVNFSKIQTPIYLELQNLALNNSSSSAGGGFDYFEYQGQIYKLNAQLSGSFPVKNTLVLNKNSAITLVGTVGTPTPSGIKVQLNYGNMEIGSFPISPTKPFDLGRTAASAATFTFYIKFPPNTSLQLFGGGPGGNSAPLGTVDSGPTGWVKSPYQPGWSYGIGSGKLQVVVSNQSDGPKLSGIPNNTSYVIKGHPTNNTQSDTTIATGTTSSSGEITIPDKPGWDITIQYPLQGITHSVDIHIPLH